MTKNSKYERVYELHGSVLTSVFGSRSNAVTGRSVLSLGSPGKASVVTAVQV